MKEITIKLSDSEVKEILREKIEELIQESIFFTNEANKMDDLIINAFLKDSEPDILNHEFNPRRELLAVILNKILKKLEFINSDLDLMVDNWFEPTSLIPILNTCKEDQWITVNPEIEDTIEAIDLFIDEYHTEDIRHEYNKRLNDELPKLMERLKSEIDPSNSIMYSFSEYLIEHKGIKERKRARYNKA